jgi:hypothetical protein
MNVVAENFVFKELWDNQSLRSEEDPEILVRNELQKLFPWSTTSFVPVFWRLASWKNGKIRPLIGRFKGFLGWAERGKKHSAIFSEWVEIKLDLVQKGRAKTECPLERGKDEAGAFAGAIAREVGVLPKPQEQELGVEPARSELPEGKGKTTWDETINPEYRKRGVKGNAQKLNWVCVAF